MDTRGKTNAEFRNEVYDALARHESNFDQINSTLQTVLTEIQALRASPTNPNNQPEINLFYPRDTSQATNTIRPHKPNDNHHHLKLHFPKFNGEDSSGWIYKAEQYFEFQNISPDQRVQLASFHLEGIALQWHRWIMKFCGPHNWDEFTKAILHRFGPTDYEEPSEALTRLRQTSTVLAYQEAFEKLSHLVDGLPEAFLVGYFTAGLHDEVRLDVKIKQPKTLADAIGVARLVEERNTLQKKPPTISNVSSTSNHIPSQQIQNSSTAGILGTPLNLEMAPTTSPPVRCISGHEARDRRIKGLCFYCDEKYVPGHICQRPQFFMIEDCPTNLKCDDHSTTEALPSTELLPGNNSTFLSYPIHGP